MKPKLKLTPEQKEYFKSEIERLKKEVNTHRRRKCKHCEDIFNCLQKIDDNQIIINYIKERIL